VERFFDRTLIRWNCWAVHRPDKRRNSRAQSACELSFGGVLPGHQVGTEVGKLRIMQQA
jgi:hypothetical protein